MFHLPNSVNGGKVFGGDLVMQVVIVLFRVGKLATIHVTLQVLFQLVIEPVN